MSFWGEFPEGAEPFESRDEGSAPECVDRQYLGADAVTADETQGPADIIDDLPADNADTSLSVHDGNAHNQEAKDLLDSLQVSGDAAPVVSSSEWRQACDVVLEAAEVFVDQGDTTDIEPRGGTLGGPKRVKSIAGDDGTGHDLETHLTPALMAAVLPVYSSKIIVQEKGDARNTGRGVEYTVWDSFGMVMRKIIDPTPRDLEAAAERLLTEEIGEGLALGAAEPEAALERFDRVFRRNTRNIVEADRMGVGRHPIGLNEARRLAHLLLGRETE